MPARGASPAMDVGTTSRVPGFATRAMSSGEKWS